MKPSSPMPKDSVVWRGSQRLSLSPATRRRPMRSVPLLESEGKEYVVTENVMPEIGVLEVDKVRTIIRELFISKIVEAKGLKNAEAFIDEILMPTPTAVLTAARLLAEGTDGEEGHR